MNDVDSRDCELKSIHEKTQVSEVPDRLRHQAVELQRDYERLKSHGDDITQQLAQSLADRQALCDSLLTTKLWIDGKEQELRAAKILPLTSVDAGKKLEDIEVCFLCVY